MASNVIGHVIGSDRKVLDSVDTVGDVREKLGIDANYAASVNGDPADDSDELEDQDYVSFSRQVKGGR